MMDIFCSIWRSLAHAKQVGLIGESIRRCVKIWMQIILLYISTKHTYIEMCINDIYWLTIINMCLYEMMFALRQLDSPL